MKKIKKIITILCLLPFLLPAQTLTVNNTGAAITIKGNTAIKISGNYTNQTGGRIKNSGIINLTGDWTRLSSNPVFLNTNGTVKFSGNSSPEIGGGSTTFNTLVVDAEVNLHANTLVSQNLTFNSNHLYLSHFNLQMLSGSDITGATSSRYVVTNYEGNLICNSGTTEKEFPVGTAFEFAPVVLANNSGTDEFAVRIFDDVLENGTSGSSVSDIEKTVKHTWVITDPDGSINNPDFDLDIFWNGSMEGNDFDRADASVSQYNGSDWQMLSAVGTLGSDPYSISQTSVTGLGAFTVKANPQKYHFVKVGGSGTQDGTSWANASPSIQDMLDVAKKGDSVWVAAGTYYPETENGGTGDRYKSFLFSQDSICLLGGFAGNEDPGTYDLSQRDFIAHETILSGDVGVQGDSLDNCYNIFYLAQDTAIILDGFTVERGQADYPSYDYIYGYGGALNARKSIFTLQNMVFRKNASNYSGAVFIGKYQQDCEMTVSKSKFTNNYSINGEGGGIYAEYSDLIIDDCLFENNTSKGHGGAISFYSPSTSKQFVVTNTAFNNNISNQGFYAGGAIYIFGSGFVVSKCSFNQNSVYGYGGAISLDSYTQSGLIEDCSFIENLAFWGGAISCYHSSFEINRSIFKSNVGSARGGVIYYSGTGTVTIKNSLMYDNSAQYEGGAIVMDIGNLRMSNTTVSENTCPGGGSYPGSILYLRLGDMRIFNTIVWNNPSPYQILIVDDNTEPEFYYCDIEGGKEGFGGDGAGSNYSFDYDNAHNIDSDPLFTNASTDNYTLSGFSPCINSGTPVGTTGSPYPYVEQSAGGDWILYYDGGSDNLGTTGLANNPRIYDNIIDIGAYEAQSVSAGIALNLKAFLEGPFKTSDMGANLTSIPLSQPYDTSPWNYAGNESVTSIPNANVVDWVLVELRDATSAGGATSATRLARQAAFILKDGSIVGTDGSSLLQFNVSVTNNLYAIVWHRNHLGIMSASAITETGGLYTYNFTTAVNKAYQSGQKLLSGKAAMFGGDVNGNGTVNTADITVWSGGAGTKGYLSSDMNMDSQADNKDKNDVWVGNVNEQTKVPN
jgi:predicted outer membrane repeat protein